MLEEQSADVVFPLNTTLVIHPITTQPWYVCLFPLLSVTFSVCQALGEVSCVQSAGVQVSGCGAVWSGAAGPLPGEGFIAQECHHRGLGSLRH